jgi:uncharacterized ion transporter superfamily protein YfcC
MDFSRAGLKESFVKGAKVLLWVALSAVITKGIEMVTSWKPDTTEWVLVQTVVNAVLVQLSKWLTTKK